MDGDIWVVRRSGARVEPVGDVERQYRTDHGRIINSRAFRSMQSKTQVMGVGETGCCRTRLTHSLEVAHVGACIARRLQLLSWRALYAPLKQWVPPVELVQAICLAHDIGHPPYGHGGEAALNFHMLDSGGFEGNGQTLRVLARLGEFSEGFGYDLTRRTLLGVLKYPATFKRISQSYPEKPLQAPLSLKPWHPPKCIHDDDLEILDWVLAPFDREERKALCALSLEGDQLKTTEMPFDASIMDLADDIAYGVHDLEDGLSMGLVRAEQVLDCLGDGLASLSRFAGQKSDHFEKMLLDGSPARLKALVGTMESVFVEGILPEVNGGFEHPLLNYRACMEPERKAVLETLIRFVFEEVICQKPLQEMEFRGQKILSELFPVLLDNWRGLVPRRYHANVDTPGYSRARIVCDYLASLTDTEANSLFQRLFLPATRVVVD
ncbi:anti-phage deoxyguanosine triphosphatase [Biformimicrobium ophioploci]|uniref:Anti-phage deoxyguanosine triphosphatase n=1 Tax=Biformimicrobium ophioploci TaxID=3036711 RepID=A0ABQ6LWQ6_9GAMM|nr:anti-phage deoxyguanosine triphosphatase [Microbulbifer sp. NKW57]GMG86496.1 anti-phage deoxyguanosine triphosphatase [Microbulbifer sp. NKW57]